MLAHSSFHACIPRKLLRLFPNLLQWVKITLVEAGPALLGPFDSALQTHALGLFKNRSIDVRLDTAVIGVEEYHPSSFRFPGRKAILSDNSSIPFGTMVWSAGLTSRRFTDNLDIQFERHPRNKRLLVDEYCRVIGYEGSIWAIGDAAINAIGTPLPQLAQAARQQGLYLADVLNGILMDDEKPFDFFSLGSMAFMGENQGIYDGSTIGPPQSLDGQPKGVIASLVAYIRNKHPRITGVAALLLWRFAYWGRQTSVANKILIPVHWFKTYLFGRDVSRY
jgi:NADH dehydrogenase FAD-containing subunit